MNLRDNDLQSIIFTDMAGNSYTIKSMREYTPQTTWFTLNLQQGDEIDEIASRKEVYGNGGEAQYYKIVNHNIAALFDVGFDLSQLKTLDVPLP